MSTSNPLKNKILETFKTNLKDWVNSEEHLYQCIGYSEGCSCCLEEYGGSNIYGTEGHKKLMALVDNSLDAYHTEHMKELRENINAFKLPYTYKRQSPFLGESVDFHLKTYGHLPDRGCCRFNQLTDEETDVYNQALDDILDSFE